MNIVTRESIEQCFQDGRDDVCLIFPGFELFDLFWVCYPTMGSKYDGSLWCRDPCYWPQGGGSQVADQRFS